MTWVHCTMLDEEHLRPQTIKNSFGIIDYYHHDRIGELELEWIKYYYMVRYYRQGTSGYSGGTPMRISHYTVKIKHLARKFLLQFLQQLPVKFTKSRWKYRNLLLNLQDFIRKKRKLTVISCISFTGRSWQQ